MFPGSSDKAHAAAVVLRLLPVAGRAFKVLGADGGILGRISSLS